MLEFPHKLIAEHRPWKYPQVSPGIFESYVWALKLIHGNSSPTSVGTTCGNCRPRDTWQGCAGLRKRVQSRGRAAVAQGLRMSGVGSWDRNPGWTGHAWYQIFVLGQVILCNAESAGVPSPWYPPQRDSVSSWWPLQPGGSDVSAKKQPTTVLVACWCP